MKNRIFKIILVLLLLIYPINTYSNPLNVNIGDTIYLGRYYQNNLNYQEDIEWVVLDIKDGKALVFSKYILDAMSFSIVGTIAYGNSIVRKFLNEDFYKNFSEEEKKKIVLTHNEGSTNSVYNINDTLATDDYVFLLSHEEIKKYFYDEYKSIINNTVIGIGTEYAKSKKLQCIKEVPLDGKETSPYWLRSIGYNAEFYQVVSYSGRILEDGYFFHRYNCGVRPAMWIKID